MTTIANNEKVLFRFHFPDSPEIDQTFVVRFGNYKEGFYPLLELASNVRMRLTKENFLFIFDFEDESEFDIAFEAVRPLLAAA